MVLDSKMHLIRRHFNIQDLSDWVEVRPDEITTIPDIGPQTLNLLRLHLANSGLTLKDDRTPAHWQSSLSIIRGVVQLSEQDNSVTSPFTILIDSAEQHPFRFQGFKTDADKQNRPMIVQTRRQHLGATRGDYSVEGLEGIVHIERKSLEDVQSTVLGWGERREQFQRTLTFLAEIPSSAIVVECTLGQAISQMRSRGSKTVEQNRKIFQRQVSAWADDYRVPWHFCDNRELAEIVCFRQLERQWKHDQARKKKASKASEELFLAGI